MKNFQSILFLVILIPWIMISSPVSADIAPPQQPPGFNPEPGNELTMVRMLAETVILDVPVADPPIAHVSADFTMRNLGSSTEDMAVRFPLSSGDGSCNINEIENVKINVNGRSTAYERTESSLTTCGSDKETSKWAEFDVSFPAGEDVGITVSYDLDGTGYEYETYTYFNYILQTGAGWKGTIGSGEIILRLPYDANPQNVILDAPMGSQGSPEFEGREAHWTFTELEPTVQDNLTFDIVKPLIWNQVVIELAKVTQNPQDGEAWGFLGKAYKQALFASGKGYPRDDAAASELYELSREAYENALALKPEDGLWHAGYAELLLDEYYWSSWYDRSYTDELDQGLRELDLAVRLAPQAPKVKELLEEYLYMFPDYIVQQSDGSLDFISLTATPQPTPEAATLVPTISLAPRLATLTPIPRTEPTSAPASPWCGGAALVLVPLALVLRGRRLG